MKVVIGIYSHPEFYPPTLNAINILSNEGHDIEVVYNNVLKSTWPYNINVKLFPSGSLKPQKKIEVSSFFSKIGRWLKFNINLYKCLKNADTFIAYDPIPLFSYRIVSKLLLKKPPTIWYHNHDVHEINKFRKYSIGWFAIKSEYTHFKFIDIFSLPSKERKEFFSLDNFKGKYFLIPNYPSLLFYKRFMAIENPNYVNILFQGNISAGHGIEQLMDLLPREINGKNIHIILKGFISDNYLKSLKLKAFNLGIKDYLHFVGVTPYYEVPNTTESCHIGIAIFTNTDIMNRTLGSASNKIYEYIACGLPILYYDNVHFNNYLSNYKWAVSTDLSEKSLSDSLFYLINNFKELSISAKKDFENELNYENNLLQVTRYLESLNAEKHRK